MPSTVEAVVITTGKTVTYHSKPNLNRQSETEQRKLFQIAVICAKQLNGKLYLLSPKHIALYLELSTTLESISSLPTIINTFKQVQCVHSDILCMTSDKMK